MCYPLIVKAVTNRISTMFTSSHMKDCAVERKMMHARKSKPPFTLWTAILANNNRHTHQNDQCDDSSNNHKFCHLDLLLCYSYPTTKQQKSKACHFAFLTLLSWVDYLEVAGGVCGNLILREIKYYIFFVYQKYRIVFFFRACALINPASTTHVNCARGCHLFC